jgi:uncharacterized Fe-S cluster protein YjdI
MKAVTKYYTNGEITVVWENALCQHSTICWKGLLEVFDPGQSPWINIHAAETQRIIEQVNKCPSGALSYFVNNEKNSDS